MSAENLNQDIHRVEPEDIAIYEKRMHIAGFAMWAFLTTGSVINYSLGEGSYTSSLLAAGAAGGAVFTEYLRHERVTPYKEAWFTED